MATPVRSSARPLRQSMPWQAYTQETSGANLQADSAVFELSTNGIPVDFHLSGAMSNRLVAADATPANPVTLTVQDMYTLMPYENSLLVLSMNGPQIKEVLERGYRNWWWYNQGSPYGGYSHYTTCMLTTDAGNVITYTGDLRTEPDGNNVASLTLDGVPVDFTRRRHLLQRVHGKLPGRRIVQLQQCG